MRPIFNIGILAHVDAGKTTITENLLYLGGATRTLGSVDKGSAITDSLSIEQERGISVKAATVSFPWKDCQINLIDTPGHADFSAEVERVLSVLDGAILVVSAVEGVQAHTFALWEALKDLDIPTLIFVNKIDRAGADFESVLADLQKELPCAPVPVSFPENEGTNEADINAALQSSFFTQDSYLRTIALENLAEFDEAIMEKYLEEKELTHSEIEEAIKTNSSPKKIVPVFCGIAKNGIGMEELLNGVINFLPPASVNKQAPLSALVFKIEHHKTDGRLAHIRVFEGVINSKDSIYLPSLEKEVKIGLAQKFFTSKPEITGKIEAGDIGVITGLPDVNAGDILGSGQGVKKQHALHIPVLTTLVKPDLEKDYAALAKALQIINSEDPSLDFKWYKEEKELHLKMMGPMQIEIISALLLERFDILATFEDPTVIYKETPASKAEGFVRYWMPKPCWAIMKFLIEPGPPGSGLVYESQVRTSDIHQKYQNEVERTIPKALEQGIKGWEVTDIKITLIEGEDHEIHSRPGDFVLATPMGIMRGLDEAGTKLLEPILNFEIKAPEESLGNITSDLTKMRATFETPEFEKNRFILKGTVPVATSMNYSIQFNSSTGGKGRLVFHFAGYASCPEGEGKIREFKGVNPLNESQWILHRRGAFKAEERKL
ncbi:MAG: GTP-binding protein [Bacteroidetes bacterium]|nr:MAG: GTP-binding protein [Bacteroidota bacterium]